MGSTALMEPKLPSSSLVLENLSKKCAFSLELSLHMYFREKTAVEFLV